MRSLRAPDEHAEPFLARTVVLVEGVSDRPALEALAARDGRDLEAERVAVLPIGGAQAIGRFLDRSGRRARPELAGLCDAGEERDFRRGLERAGLGSNLTRTDLERARLLRLCRRPRGRADPRPRRGRRRTGGRRRRATSGRFERCRSSPRGRDDARGATSALHGQRRPPKIRYARLLVNALVARRCRGRSSACLRTCDARERTDPRNYTRDFGEHDVRIRQVLEDRLRQHEIKGK